MKNLIALLIKIGIPVGIGFAAVTTNPKPETHHQAINAKTASLQEQDILGQADRAMYQQTAAPTTEDGYSYHNYFVTSKVTDATGSTVSYGFFNRVFVTKSKL